jgi:hypothetical protein
LLGTTQDDEVRSRAQVAINRIEENRLTGMSRVTLHLKDVAAADAFAQLAAQAGAPLASDPPDLLKKISKPVSLDADRWPYWQVMQSLAAQTDLEVSGVTRHNREMGLGLTRGGTDWMDKPVALSGPLLIRADGLTRVSTIRLRPPRDANVEFAISLTAFAEPKLRVLDYSEVVRLVEAVDDKGNSLIPPPDANGVTPNIDVFGNHHEGNPGRWNLGATLHYPKGAGTRIARLRASAAVVVQTRAAVLDVPIAEAASFSRTLAGLRVQRRSVDSGKCELSVFRDGRDDAERYAARMQLLAGQAQLFDAGGRVVARSQGGVEAEESADNDKLDVRLRFIREPSPAEDVKPGKRKAAATAPPEPARLVWEFPAESRELSVPFEFRDLPIP